MNQQKTGAFLRELRKNRGLTQEAAAEQFGVTSRTVSRWENGNNMPDLDILLELSDFYNVDLRELLNGERKDEKMNTELKETVLEVAAYSSEEKSRLLKKMHIFFIAGLAGMAVFLAIHLFGAGDTSPGDCIAAFGLGIASGMLLLGVIFTSRYAVKIRNLKMRLLRKQEGEEKS